MRLSSSLMVKLLTQIVILVSFLSLHVDSAFESNHKVLRFLSCLPLHSNSSIPIKNAVYTPQNSSFAYVLQAYGRNLRFNRSTTPKPLAIVAALDNSHVQATVICAKDSGLEMRIRSGGHDYEGLSYVSPNPFIVLDMFNLRSIDIDLKNETAWVQSGATLGELYYKIANVSNIHAFPAGVCPTVGIGGHFAGGGYGNMLRKFGLTVDNIIDAQIVDVNGNILTRKTMGEDLFWAIRGGGASSFCVVLSWKINLVRVPETVTTFNVKKTIRDNVTEVMHQWFHVAPKIDPHLFIRAQAQVVNESLICNKSVNCNKTLQVSFIALYLGKASEAVKLVGEKFPLLGLELSQCNEHRWINSTLFFNDIPMNTSLEILLSREHPTPITYDKHKSDYVERPIPKEGLDAMWKKMIELKVVTLQFNPYGGQMHHITEWATPFPHRKGKLCKIQYLAYWYDNSTELSDRNIQAVRDMYEHMTPHVSSNPRENFLNYRDIDVGTNANKSVEFGHHYFKGNLKKLLQVKAKVDPTDFFRNEQSIPVLSYVGKINWL